MTAARWVLFAALVAGSSYIGSWALPLPPAAAIAWKGAGVGLLAVYAALNAREMNAGALNGWLIAAVMTFGALGDVVLETNGFVAGALAFLAGHLTAVGLYLRNRRPPVLADLTYAGALFVFIILTAYLLPHDRATAGPVAIYATGLAAMTAAAWLSRFPRPLVAAGAMMFAASDLLIFLRTGRPALDVFPMSIAVWGLYFAGQALVVLGVTLRTASPATRLPEPA
ncbi:lysoplasmalogenase family protein [Phenylobacterium sp.]|uniref:lysoplasmalogenase family protein n=1 Tax=Phenylobacterium sp. TaxID=1871053 RepID=UPI0025D66C68|nr:lysoplasmalogenase family protein [Phenylobacterium sp.]